MMFANVSDRLLVALRCGSEGLGGSGEDMGKLAGRRQPRQNWGLPQEKHGTIRKQVDTQLQGYFDGRHSRIDVFSLAVCIRYKVSMTAGALPHVL